MIDFRLYLITDRLQAPGGEIVRTVTEALEGGVRAVQLREKDLSGRRLFLLAQEMRDVTARHGAKLLINDRADVAKAVGADGVHLGVSSIPARQARRLLGPDALVGCSTHNLDELREAEQGGADFATFGPVYPTPSKAAYGAPLGLSALARACRASRIPVFALGGLGPDAVGEVRSAGAFGIALISRIIAAPSPRAAAQDLLARLESTRAAQTKEGEP